MIWWLVAIAVACLIWALIWKSNVVAAFGILLGALLAWLLSYFVKPEVTGMEDFPIWLPPLPLATVATLLFVYGAVIWFKGSDALPKPKHDEHDEH